MQTDHIINLCKQVREGLDMEYLEHAITLFISSSPNNDEINKVIIEIEQLMSFFEQEKEQKVSEYFKLTSDAKKYNKYLKTSLMQTEDA